MGEKSLSNWFLIDDYVDRNYFWSQLWGRLPWETGDDSIDNALNNKCEKFKNDHLENSNKKIERYNLYSVNHGVQPG